MFLILRLKIVIFMGGQERLSFLNLVRFLMIRWLVIPEEIY
jgi:hypothetical protein